MIVIFTQLNAIINKTIRVIEQGKGEIFEIAEMARTEYQRVEIQVIMVKQSVQEVIRQVDAADRQFRSARYHLMEVSRSFDAHSEERIKQAYEEAQLCQIELVILKERETQLRHQRDELERSLRNLLATVERADRLATHITVAMQYLRDSMQDLGGQLDGLQQRQQLGIRIIKAQEEERSRVARDIHDGPAQTLASAVMRMELCERLLDTDTGQVRRELHDLKSLVRGGLQDIRKIIYDLRPMTLDDLGLVPTLRRYIDEFDKNCPTRIELLVLGQEKRLPLHMEVGIFRIVQESLSNIVKHAAARNALIKIEYEATAIRVIIRDDGRGFDVNEPLKREGDHFGLLSMRERAELLQGTWQISSAKGHGTRITVVLPVKEEDKNGY